MMTPTDEGKDSKNKLRNVVADFLNQLKGHLRLPADASLQDIIDKTQALMIASSQIQREMQEVKFVLLELLSITSTEGFDTVQQALITRANQLVIGAKNGKRDKPFVGYEYDAADEVDKKVAKVKNTISEIGNSLSAIHNAALNPSYKATEFCSTCLISVQATREGKCPECDDPIEDALL